MNRSESSGFADDPAQPYPWEDGVEFFDRLYGTDYATEAVGGYEAVTIS